MKAIGNSNRIYAPYTVGNAPTNNVAYTDLANAFTLAQSISLATAGTIFSLTTTENNATAQAVDLYRHRAGAAGQDGDDLTELQFNGLDDNGTPQKTKYARILGEIVDASDTTEDGRLSLGTMRAGSVVDWQVESGTLRYQGQTLPATAGQIAAVGFLQGGYDAAAFSVALFQALHTETSGVNGGGQASGSYATRKLNLAATNEISGASLAANEITLPAGTYWIDATAQFNSCDAAKIKLRNVTDGVDIALGQVCDASAGSGDVSVITRRFTLSGTKNVAIQSRVTTTNVASGWGVACGFGDTEIYMDIKIWKIA